MRYRGLLAVLAIGFAGSAGAVPITFTFTGSGSGTLGGASFSDTAFTITSVGDTDARDSWSGATSGYWIDHTSTLIELGAFGTVTFTGPSRTFVNNSVHSVGFARAGAEGADLYDGALGMFAGSWDMLSDFDASGLFRLFQWDLDPTVYGSLDTDRGRLFFADNTASGTFSARLGAVTVPEPAPFALLTAGLLVLAAAWNRRRAE